MTVIEVVEEPIDYENAIMEAQAEAATVKCKGRPRKKRKLADVEAEEAEPAATHETDETPAAATRADPWPIALAAGALMGAATFALVRRLLLLGP